MHSVLEYCAPARDPFIEEDKNNLEKIQRHAACMVSNEYRYTSSVNFILKKLRWESLEERRQGLRLALMHGWMYLVTEPIENCVKPVPCKQSSADIFS